MYLLMLLMPKPKQFLILGTVCDHHSSSLWHRLAAIHDSHFLAPWSSNPNCPLENCGFQEEAQAVTLFLHLGAEM